jgi:hypothetical protein
MTGLEAVALLWHRCQQAPLVPLSARAAPRGAAPGINSNQKGEFRMNFKKLMLSTVVAAAAFWGGMAKAGPIEAVYGLQVSDPAAMVSALDTLFQADAMKGNKATLWTAVFAGTRPATHVVVATFDSWQAMDEANGRRLNSDAWRQFTKTASTISERKATVLLSQLGAWGEGGDKHGAGAAFNMTVSDPARYAAALEKLTKGYGPKGMTRLMAVRAGGEGVTHIVLVTAPTMAELNTYLDGLFASDAYKTFSGEVGDIRKLQTVNMYQRVKTWTR